jgi:predicted kinase
MEIILLIGLPGCGKSTWAKEYPCSGSKLVLCPDNYLMVDGVYTWSPEANTQAHHQCMKEFVQRVWYGDVDLLILDSTNTRTEFISPYIEVAQSFGYKVRIVLIKHDPEDSWKRNIHNIDEKRHIGMENNLRFMLKNWSQRYPHIEIVRV